MKSIKCMGMVALAFGLVTLFAGEASAQAPTVTFSVNGTSVSIQWTAVPGATSYDIIVSGTLSGQFQLPTTFVQVNAPVGTYNVQVRGRAGNTLGPLSDVATIAVGGSTPAPPPTPCSGPPSPPTVTATGSFASVTVSWTAVAGATGYAVQFSRTAGATELVVNATAGQTSLSQSVPFTGTFSVRVVAITPCGNATSADASFTTGQSTGARTPNPSPGQLIPRATLGYAAGVINQVAAQFPGDLQNSCVEHGGNNVFLFRVVSRLRAIDNRWGLNDKRGNRGDMSQDVVSYNPTERPDNGEQQIYLFDIIAGHCGNRADPWFNDVTDATWPPPGGGARAGCANLYCARWTIDRYLGAGFQADPRP